MIHFAAPQPSPTVLSTIYLWPVRMELSGTQETRYCHHAPILLNCSGHVPCLGSHQHSPLCFLCPWLISQCFLAPHVLPLHLWNLNSRADAPSDILHAFQNILSISCLLRILLSSHAYLRLGRQEATSLAPVPLVDHCSQVCRRPLESPSL